MAGKRWKPVEVFAILRETERLNTIQKVIRRYGISDQSVYS